MFLTNIKMAMRQLFRYYHYHPEFQKGIKGDEEQLQHSIDFIAGMTDRYAINKFLELFVPVEWRTESLA